MLNKTDSPHSPTRQCKSESLMPAGIAFVTYLPTLLTCSCHPLITWQISQCSSVSSIVLRCYKIENTSIPNQQVKWRTNILHDTGKYRPLQHWRNNLNSCKRIFMTLPTEANDLLPFPRELMPLHQLPVDAMNNGPRVPKYLYSLNCIIVY